MQGKLIMNALNVLCSKGHFCSYLYYHGLLDGEQYMTLLELEEALVDKVGMTRVYNRLCIQRIL